ncbi:MAG: HPr family phosphocarrier protein [Ignavibacteriales bacterium]|jgi:phosphocarrier protein|nr:HPr family phosphocarrier protein [Ignavibacteriaceae bacterium]NLH60095.1 HPr family phosphocarrier protein [Ignavibacteriales bacterium]HOJ19224.1 HPr family phosphocarrier protein [Ignavibacteriaceae bacterium]HPO56084.1 HPr family phosphocarrier protein [Ignavibacteriaceae bacterium]
MIEISAKIVNKAGLHTRPAATIVKIASKYSSRFFISKDGLRIDGKSIIGVMTLTAEMGSELNLSFDGPDEQDMSREILDYINRGFDEQ